MSIYEGKDPVFHENILFFLQGVVYGMLFVLGYHIKNILFFLQSVVYGMLFAFGYHILKKYNLIRDLDERNLFSTGLSWLLVCLGVIGIGVSSLFTVHALQSSKNSRVAQW